MPKHQSISDLKPTEVSKRLGISRSYAFELIKRIKTPSLDVALRIEREYGIPPRSWLPSESKTAP